MIDGMHVDYSSGATRAVGRSPPSSIIPISAVKHISLILLYVAKIPSLKMKMIAICN